MKVLQFFFANTIGTALGLASFFGVLSIPTTGNTSSNPEGVMFFALFPGLVNGSLLCLLDAITGKRRVSPAAIFVASVMMLAILFPLLLSFSGPFYTFLVVAAAFAISGALGVVIMRHFYLPTRN